MAKKRKQTSRKTRRRRSTAFPAKQWEMPAGFCADGSSHASLREVVDPNVATLQLSDLTLQQRANLVVQRLQLQKKIDLAMVGAGQIDKARAITEVKNKTRVGRLLIEIEHQMIRNLIEQSQNAKRRKPSGKRAGRSSSKKK